MIKEVVQLANNMSLVVLNDESRTIAIDLAYRLTMSEHEWEWTDSEAATMANYVLWAHQRLSGIHQLVAGGLAGPAEAPDAH